MAAAIPTLDPCRLARQVKQFVTCEALEQYAAWERIGLAAELLHLPGKPAGVEEKVKLFPG